ncbi:MAG: prolyl-tRNA synthetase associated domain-containing protein [Erysipelotrichaceae bacterium]|nr:prolyl-tRNA synthetase associated domain-containing protein [Erysipelotrichaceae bacterium]
MNREEILSLLKEKGITYELQEHPAAKNMEEIASVGLLYPEQDAKNLFVRDDKKHYYLLSVRGDKRIDLKQFRKQEGLRTLSFAKSEELQEILSLSPGEVTPLGVLNDEERRVIVYLDEEFRGGLIGVHPNDNRATLWLSAADLCKLILGHGNEVRYVPFQEKRR